MSDMETMYQDHMKAPKVEPIKVRSGDGWSYVASGSIAWDVTKWDRHNGGYTVTLAVGDASMEVLLKPKDLRSLARGIIKLMEVCGDTEL